VISRFLQNGTQLETAPTRSQQITFPDRKLEKKYNIRPIIKRGFLKYILILRFEKKEREIYGSALEDSPAISITIVETCLMVIHHGSNYVADEQQ
jgi:hypothetical protein